MLWRGGALIWIKVTICTKHLTPKDLGGQAFYGISNNTRSARPWVGALAPSRGEGRARPSSKDDG